VGEAESGKKIFTKPGFIAGGGGSMRKRGVTK